MHPLEHVTVPHHLIRGGGAVHMQPLKHVHVLLSKRMHLYHIELRQAVFHYGRHARIHPCVRIAWQAGMHAWLVHGRAMQFEQCMHACTH